MSLYLRLVSHPPIHPLDGIISVHQFKPAVSRRINAVKKATAVTNNSDASGRLHSLFETLFKGPSQANETLKDILSGSFKFETDNQPVKEVSVSNGKVTLTVERNNYRGEIRVIVTADKEILADKQFQTALGQHSFKAKITASNRSNDVVLTSNNPVTEPAQWGWCNKHSCLGTSVSSSILSNFVNAKIELGHVHNKI